jgi:hypothetical protein
MSFKGHYPESADPPKPKRKWTPPVSSTMMRKAQQENFAIFQLKGMLASINSPYLRAEVCQDIRQDIIWELEMAIKAIKSRQEFRMALLGLKRKPKINPYDEML